MLCSVIEIKPAVKFYDYDAKYKDERTRYIVLESGKTMSEKSLTHSTYVAVQELAVSAHNSLGCRDFSRVDMILGNDGKVYVLEANTIPGFTERSLLPKAARAADISFEELCNNIVNTALLSDHNKDSEEGDFKASQLCCI